MADTGVWILTGVLATGMTGALVWKLTRPALAPKVDVSNVVAAPRPSKPGPSPRGLIDAVWGGALRDLPGVQKQASDAGKVGAGINGAVIGAYGTIAYGAIGSGVGALAGMPQAGAATGAIGGAASGALGTVVGGAAVGGAVALAMIGQSAFKNGMAYFGHG